MASDPNANYVNPPHIEKFLATLDDTGHDQSRQPIQDHFAEVFDLEQKQRYWDTRSDTTASDADVKATRLAPIQKRLAELADERKLLRGDVLEAPHQVRQLIDLPPLELDGTQLTHTLPSNMLGADPTTIATAVSAKVVAQIRKPYKTKRRNLLSPLIKEAQAACADPYDAHSVWARMREFAVAKRTPLIGVTDEGLQWMDGLDVTQYLSLKNLRDRLFRQQKNA